MRSVALAALLLAPVISLADDAYFFRVVSTQTTHIVHFTPANEMAWSNATFPASCLIEWTPDLRGLWLTNHFSTVVCTTAVVTSQIPMVFSTGQPSAVLYQQVNGVAGDGGPGNTVDLDADGTWDVQFRQYYLTNWEVTDELLDVDADRPAIILTPYTNGQIISQAPSPPDSWTVYKWPMNLAIRRVGGSDPGFTGGPWADVTNGYLPVRMSLSGGFHYGWIALELQPTGGMVRTRITDCGLHAVPGHSIQAGQK